MDIMARYNRHWLEYDAIALPVLLVGIGIVELLALSI
jgi:hypothetical protein